MPSLRLTYWYFFPHECECESEGEGSGLSELWRLSLRLSAGASSCYLWYGPLWYYTYARANRHFIYYRLYLLTHLIYALYPCAFCAVLLYITIVNKSKSFINCRLFAIFCIYFPILLAFVTLNYGRDKPFTTAGPHERNYNWAYRGRNNELVGDDSWLCNLIGPVYCGTCFFL